MENEAVGLEGEAPGTVGGRARRGPTALMLLLMLLSGSGAMVWVVERLSRGAVKVTDDREIIVKIEGLLEAGERAWDGITLAESRGDDVGRREAIVEARDSFTAVIKEVDGLRLRPPYGSAKDELEPGYEFLEEYQVAAARRLHGLIQRTRPGDW